MNNEISKPLPKLNAKQEEAIHHIDGPLLILAGAGTGKTLALISRIVNILQLEKAFPSEILAVTFTNKAANEMQERISQILPLRLKWLGTFHSICAKMLRVNAEAANLSSSFSIIDVDDQIRVIKQIMNDFALDIKQFNPKMISSIIQRWKDLALNVEDVSESDLKTDYHVKALRIYREYQDKLDSNDSLDFGDLLLKTVNMFKRKPEILEHYQTLFKYVLVDEYQDTNTAQYIWLRMLAQKRSNICCVGDDDQSIYGWRGAEIGNILKFEEDFPGAKIIKLEQNYRSTNCILSAASALIANNNMRHSKTLWTETESNEKIVARSFFNDKEEASFIAKEIMCKFKHNLHQTKVAILVRALFQTRIIEECFMRSGIPYKVVGSLKFYERQEIKDIVAYIKLAIKCNDDLPFERIINKPARGIGKTTIQKIRDFANTEKISLFSATELMLESKGSFAKKTTESLSVFIKMIKKWHEEFQTLHHTDVVKNILTESGYEAFLKFEDSIEGRGRLENAKELLQALEDFKTILDFLDHITLVTDNDNNKTQEDLVTIMTLHGAKGLEFDAVFLPGWEEGLFPHSKSLDESGDKGLEEERRLAYVGMTRAKKNLYISHSLTRRMYNQWIDSMPSRFLKEIPREFLTDI
ncbi:MAG: UvrD-helicase domain-containing protein [Alphaproteobacteria bacterium]|nr:UvrD-helicase domain-containing protein [Alphaproteobacteria bacterium]